jgi:hypothetical protein
LQATHVYSSLDQTARSHQISTTIAPHPWMLQSSVGVQLSDGSSPDSAPLGLSRTGAGRLELHTACVVATFTIPFCRHWPVASSSALASGWLPAFLSLAGHQRRVPTMGRTGNLTPVIRHPEPRRPNVLDCPLSQGVGRVRRRHIGIEGCTSVLADVRQYGVYGRLMSIRTLLDVQSMG